jgi:hypothetical protein
MMVVKFMLIPVDVGKSLTCSIVVLQHVYLLVKKGSTQSILYLENSEVLVKYQYIIC